ncbi:hypothetical protein FCOIX_11473 [Fusarium coicis]|nr:hypothetical protein FCOIX_11473 [Fusarium coicis]
MVSLAQRLGKWYQFRFNNLTLNVPSTYITNNGTLSLLFKDKDEYKMKDVDELTGRVLVDYIMSHTYEVDYETAKEDEDMALREYKIALKAWAIGRRYNIHSLAVLARDHAVKLAEFMNPVWALVEIVDTPLVMEHITGIIHRVDDYTEEFLQSLTREEATDLLLRIPPPSSVGWLWATLQLMRIAQGPALERGWSLVHQTLPTLMPGLRECLPLLEELRRVIRENEYRAPAAIDPFDDDDDAVEHVLNPFNHWIPDAKIKCGKVMRAMVRNFNSCQKIGTRNKEKPAERDKYCALPDRPWNRPRVLRPETLKLLATEKKISIHRSPRRNRMGRPHAGVGSELELLKTKPKRELRKLQVRESGTHRVGAQTIGPPDTHFLRKPMLIAAVVDAQEQAPVFSLGWGEVPKAQAFKRHYQWDSPTVIPGTWIHQLTPGSSQNSPDD